MKLNKILRAKTFSLLNFALPKALENFGYTPIRGVSFLYAEGDLPVLLVAHADTVHDKLPRQIFFDEKKRVLWSPEGLGADDRAGIYAILRILRMGYHPYVLITDGEEAGCFGAYDAAFSLNPQVRFIIELDRRGKNDAVYYDCDSPEFEAYVAKFGFTFAWGSYSDISILCPEWKIVGVNLSIGYYNEHSLNEYLSLRDLENTIKRVKSMLDNIPENTFKYQEIEKWNYEDLEGPEDWEKLEDWENSQDWENLRNPESWENLKKYAEIPI